MFIINVTVRTICLSFVLFVFFTSAFVSFSPLNPHVFLKFNLNLFSGVCAVLNILQLFCVVCKRISLIQNIRILICMRAVMMFFRRAPCRFCLSRCLLTVPGVSAIMAVMEGRSGELTSGLWNTEASPQQKLTELTWEWWEDRLYLLEQKKL